MSEKTEFAERVCYVAYTYSYVAQYTLPLA